MSIVGIHSLLYSVSELPKCGRFFDDFGLMRAPSDAGSTRFRLPEGSEIVLRDRNDPALPSSEVVGDGVREVVWGVVSEEELAILVDGLRTDRDVTRVPDGTVRFMTDFGLSMGLKVVARRPVVTAPDPVNAPGSINRLNTHRKWRERAYPKVINHVVFAVPDYEAGTAFMCDRLGFRLSDEQAGFGRYLRAPGSNNHHNLLLLNASAPLPDMDGQLRFHHANFGVEDIDEIMIGANHMTRRGWEASHFGLGRHRIDSALFYYLPCPAGGEAEYGADADYIDDSWVPRRWPEPLFAYAHFVHNLPPFLRSPPSWRIEYSTAPVELGLSGEEAQ